MFLPNLVIGFLGMDMEASKHPKISETYSQILLLPSVFLLKPFQLSQRLKVFRWINKTCLIKKNLHGMFLCVPGDSLIEFKKQINQQKKNNNTKESEQNRQPPTSTNHNNSPPPQRSCFPASIVFPNQSAYDSHGSSSWWPMRWIPWVVWEVVSEQRAGLWSFKRNASNFLLKRQGVFFFPGGVWLRECAK